jgi:hypothetical protein
MLSIEMPDLRVIINEGAAPPPVAPTADRRSSGVR